MAPIRPPSSSSNKKFDTTGVVISSTYAGDSWCLMLGIQGHSLLICLEGSLTARIIYIDREVLDVLDEGDEVEQLNKSSPDFSDSSENNNN